MQLTKEQAIEEHRKMWDWIADQISKSNERVNIYNLKEEYCDMHGLNINNDCFLCEYTSQFSDLQCIYVCPLIWEADHLCGCMGNRNSKYGLFVQCVDATNWKEQYELAHKIANLPERK